MKEYLIEISLDQQQEINKVVTSLLKYGVKLNKVFTPMQLSITVNSENLLKKNYLVKGFLNDTNTQSLLKNSVVSNVWKSSGYIPF